MSYNETTTNLFYQNFKDTGLPPAFVALIGARWAISIVGCLLNISLVYVAIRSKSLQGNCNFLIGANALCAAMLELSLGIGLYIAVSGTNFVLLRTCFFLQAIPSLFGHLTLATMLAIGLDRLLSVSFSPFWSLQEWPLPYLSALLSLCLGYALFVLWKMFQASQALPLLPVICSSPDEVQQGEIGKFLYRLNVGLNMALLLEYGLLWVAFKMRQHSLGISASTEFTRRIIRSLTAISLLVILGWVTNSVVRLLLPQMGLSPPALSYSTFALSILPILAMASNGPLLFLFSHEYHRAFAQHFPRLLAAYASTGSTTAKHFPPYVAPLQAVDQQWTHKK